MTELSLCTQDAAYPIYLCRGGIHQADRFFDVNRRILVVTDDHVPGYASELCSGLPDARLLVLPHGETSKSVAAWERILQALLQDNFTRKDAIIAVGGGVVGDVSGFAAACYLRGIDYYNIPTTLLSQVDSSVGGKTAINYGQLKNVVGAFHQPAGVLIDPDTLQTLDERLFAEGMAEIIKMAATSDAALFERIEASRDIRGEIEEIIAAALRIKIAVVQADPKEGGLRAVLNYGHTVGHAIEADASGALYHGECVSIGMLYMASSKVRARLLPLLTRFGLPTGDRVPLDRLLSYIRHDKKMAGSKVKLVYVPEIGQYTFIQEDMETLRERLAAARREMHIEV